MISLGCAKNQVDAEIMLAALQKAGYEIKDDVALADVAILLRLRKRNPLMRS